MRKTDRRLLAAELLGVVDFISEADSSMAAATTPDDGGRLANAIAICRQALRIAPIPTDAADSALRGAFTAVLAELLIRDWRHFPDAQLGQVLTLCTSWLGRVESERDQELIAILHALAGEAFALRGNRSGTDDVEHALFHLSSALEHLPPEGHPDRKATVHHRLGCTYIQRRHGDPQENHNAALCHLDIAFTHFAATGNNRRSAIIQSDLGLAYLLLGNTGSERAIDQLQAAVAVFGELGEKWYCANAEYRLGLAFLRCVPSSRIQNSHIAIDHFRSALRVFCRPAFQVERALTQLDLARALLQSDPTGEEQRMTEAIECVNEALPVFTRLDYPRQWAMAQYTLGRAYLARGNSTRIDDIDASLHCFHAAIEVFSTAPGGAMFAVVQRARANAMRLREAYVSSHPPLED